ncbi:MAG TPA: glycosyltransferase family 2 protein [Verrucomicrobiae bacterium]
MLSADIKPGISILIPTWNGEALLRQYLPPLHAVMSQYAGPWECVIVDDGSTDETLSMLAADFSWARVVPLPKNGGVSPAFNAGLRETKYPLVLSLNNDVRVKPGFLEPLLEAFRTIPDLFGAGSLQRGRNPKGEPISEGYAELVWRNGVFFLKDETDQVLAGRTPNPGYLGLACALLDREKLVALQGMNEIFTPFYWEDAELCIRARLAGWQICFCPASQVDHCHSTTTRKKPLLLRIIPVRNLHLIHWLLLDDSAFWRDYRSKMGRRMLRETLQGKFGLLGGLMLALLKLPVVMRSRRRYVALRKRNLRDIVRIEE